MQKKNLLLKYVFTFMCSQLAYVTKPLFFVCLFRAAPAAHGSSQARGRIGAPAAGLRHSSWQHQILKPTKARDRTCVLMDTNWVHYC